MATHMGMDHIKVFTWIWKIVLVQISQFKFASDQEPGCNVIYLNLCAIDWHTPGHVSR